MIETVDSYIESFSDDIQEKLICLRRLIKENVPEANEVIAWGVPTYNLNGFLVQFAAYKKHIGFYTSPRTLQHFQRQLKGYKTNSKNTLHLPINQDLPIELLKEMILYKVRENQEH